MDRQTHTQTTGWLSSNNNSSSEEGHTDSPYFPHPGSWHGPPLLPPRAVSRRRHLRCATGDVPFLLINNTHFRVFLQVISWGMKSLSGLNPHSGSFVARPLQIVVAAIVAAVVVGPSFRPECRSLIRVGRAQMAWEFSVKQSFHVNLYFPREPNQNNRAEAHLGGCLWNDKLPI